MLRSRTVGSKWEFGVRLGVRRYEGRTWPPDFTRLQLMTAPLLPNASVIHSFGNLPSVQRKTKNGTLQFLWTAKRLPPIAAPILHEQAANENSTRYDKNGSEKERINWQKSQVANANELLLLMAVRCNWSFDGKDQKVVCSYSKGQISNFQSSLFGSSLKNNNFMFFFTSSSSSYQILLRCHANFRFRLLQMLMRPRPSKKYAKPHNNTFKICGSNDA